MARYSYDQVFQMIDESYTPEFREIEKQIEKQHYLNFFTEMHNYISENIIELPFDADVILEEENKSVWDKSDTGWGGFWRNIWRVIKNIFETFWKFIKSLVGISSKNVVSDDALKNNANSASSASAALDRVPDSGVVPALNKNPQNKEELKTALNEIKADIGKLKERYAKQKGMSQQLLSTFDSTGNRIQDLINKIDTDKVTKDNLTTLIKPMLDTCAKAERGGLLQKCMNYAVSWCTVFCMVLNQAMSLLTLDLNRSIPVQNATKDSDKSSIKAGIVYAIMNTFTPTTGVTQAYSSSALNGIVQTRQIIANFVNGGDSAPAKKNSDIYFAVASLMVCNDKKDEAVRDQYKVLNITKSGDPNAVDTGLNTAITTLKDSITKLSQQYADNIENAKLFNIEDAKNQNPKIEVDDTYGTLLSSNAIGERSKVNDLGDINKEILDIIDKSYSKHKPLFQETVTNASGWLGTLFGTVIENKEVSFAKIVNRIKKVADCVNSIFEEKK